MEIKYTFALINNNFNVSFDYARIVQILQEIPKEIGIKLIKNETYIVKSQVSPEIFQNFLDYWQHSKKIEFNSDNMFEYFLLSQEFGIKIDSFSEKSNENIFHISILKYILKNNQNNILFDKSEQEKYIALHLDSFLQNYEDQLLSIPITSLFNIFFHKERILNVQQKAFDFINEHKNQNPDLLLLLPSLSSEQLNKEKFIDSMANIDKNYGFCPQISSSFFDSYNVKIEQLTDENQEYKKAFNRLIYHFLKEDKNIECVKSILNEKCFDVNSKITYKEEEAQIETTVLCMAIEIEDIDLVKFLVEKPELDSNITTIIIEKEEEEEVFELFRGKEKDEIKEENKEKEILIYENITRKETTPLCMAVNKQNIEIIKLLLSRPELDVNGKSVKEYRNFIPISIKPSPSLLKLAESFIESPESLFQSKERLKKTLEVVEKDETNALHMSIDNIEIAKLLLSHQFIDVNYKKIERFFVKSEINLFVGFENKEFTPLYSAIDKYYDRNEFIKLLLSHPKIDINIKYKGEFNQKWSLLAYFYFAIESFESILELKIPLNKSMRNYGMMEEKSPLHLAVKWGKIEIINSLLERPELDINCKSFSKAYNNFTLTEAEISEFLLKYPDADEMKIVGEEEIQETSLHIAVKKENVKIINLLVCNANIDFEVTDKQGKKPIDITDNDTIKSLLIKHHQ
ncbi:hypothetical protein M9Y10_039319 [Tritrichomonas musculus]|uniref:DUF3447 domain-containing protein n=1 Tax=Tritrichomonas musculus TaxID=1915356 RepID=A0ABR2KAV6_9EUKA